MAEVMITGKRPLKGEIKISGSKNAVLPEMAACLLTEEKVVLTNVPEISDKEEMIKTLQSYQVSVNSSSDKLEIQAGNLSDRPSENAGDKTRASFLVLGGCSLQNDGRPVDFHIEAMKEMGAELVEETTNKVLMKATHGLKPATITFPKSSVGATQTVMMAASLSESVGSSRDAEKMGAKIIIKENVLIQERITEFDISEYISTWNVIIVRGRNSLRGVRHEVMPDRIEFGTYAIAAAMNKGSILLKVKEEMQEKMLKSIEKPLYQAGVKITREHNGVRVSLPGNDIEPADIETGPYPSFPTDLLPQWVTFMTQARPTHCTPLTGDHVQATDLRGGAALVLAGLVAQGSTVVKNFEHIKRGYPDMIGKLNGCGAKLEILKPPRHGFHGGPEGQFSRLRID
ncbi:UDP-N-acetylglucosamine 1-carboxyvinyltransferase-like [Xenia sp. Carnegie-2017]|uniref:UDP-N-acetylglucosamine 1-carboxyvinyltransferase-like n=1 Tax=Xenia sp. Carnegie-2017 TaxID=2897299 RepID=UPI001F040FB8|nr:UDP-N-acetylglucosamine 1-carboxyvinyltransferase-like [Xenia sp. Carnegie-2017]